MLSRPRRVHAQLGSADSPSGGGVEARSPSVDAARGVLDAGAIARLNELDPTGANRLVGRVLQAFQASVARLRPQLDAARLIDDRNAIRLVAHTLKSSSASIGALSLSQLCAQLETLIRVDPTADLSGPLAAFDTDLDEALRAIDALLKERP